MTELVARLAKEFLSRFNKNPMLVAAPGRINLIGEHVDYNDGLVLPGAVDKVLVFIAAENGTDRCNIYSDDFKESATFSLADTRPGSHWVNYFMGVIEGMRRQGQQLQGVDCVFGGMIPAGAGLSSSAALCCGFGFALKELFQLSIDRLGLARIGQFSEHNFAGVKCGLMDQYASLFGEKDSLLLLDCRAMKHETVTFPTSECSIVLADTQVKHSLASSAYNNRRASCEEGVSILQKVFPNIKSLRDASVNNLDQCKDSMTPEIHTRCKFIVEEIARTQTAAQALRAGDLVACGKLMFRSHEGLQLDYEVSCPELDVLVAAAAKNDDIVMGSRLMGGGFGGCTINLVRRGMEEAFRTLVSKEYFTSFRTTPGFYQVTLAQGIHRITNNI